MAGALESPSTWRLRSNSQIPFKFLGTDGEFTPEEGSVNWSVLIPSNQLIAFLQEMFPPPLVIGNVAIPQTALLPGLTTLAARRLSFKAHDSSRPIDPFGFDSSAPTGTYGDALQCDIEFGPREVQEPRQTDPFTFLEITGNTTGEFLHSTMPRARWQPRRNPDLDDQDDDQDPSGGVADPDTNEPGNGAVNPEDQAPEVNRDPTVPVTILVPQTEWTIRWNQIPFEFFSNVLIHRLRILLGRVNSAPVPVLFGALPETLLFAGYNYSNQFTWRDGNVGTPPVNLEIKIIEKRVLWKGVIRGHNDFWRPGVGWQRLLQDGENPVYSSWDYNGLFSVGNT